MSVGIVLHSGGPTPVINASLLGVVEAASGRSRITQLLGARFGIDGILKQDFVDLFAAGAIPHTPSSALGASRRYVDDETLAAILKVLRWHAVEYLFITGGNGSMGAAARIAESSDIRVIGIPKTIDNDLTRDHTMHFTAALLRLRRARHRSRQSRSPWPSAIH